MFIAIIFLYLHCMFVSRVFIKFFWLCVFSFSALEIYLGSQQLPSVLPRQTSVFIVITSAKILLRWLFPSKIYIQLIIFNTYFSTKLLFANKRYHLHVLENCLYVLQEVRSIIYFRQFIDPPSLMFLNFFLHLIFFRSRTRRYRASHSCSNVAIIMILFEKKRMPKFWHMP